MASDDSNDILKNVDWKTVASTGDANAPVIKRRLRKKIRQIPEDYFLPRRPLSASLAFYAACCAAGVGAGMVMEVWIKKKIKEDGGAVWDV